MRIKHRNGCVIVTNDGPAVDQRQIKTVPAPPEIVHAERETFEVDNNGYLELPFLRNEEKAPAEKIPPEFRGCSAAFIHGFLKKPLPHRSSRAIIKEYTRGEAAASKLTAN